MDDRPSPNVGMGKLPPNRSPRSYAVFTSGGAVAERRQSDKKPEEIEQWIEEAAERGAQKAVAELSSKVEGWIIQAGTAGGEAGAAKAHQKLLAEIGRAGLRKAVYLLWAAVAVVLGWLGLKGHIPK